MQHITPSFTVEEKEEVLKPLYEHIKNVEAEIAEFKAKLTLA
ncbi:hypothetical protein [Emticicia sp. SJ17W-69]